MALLRRYGRRHAAARPDADHSELVDYDMGLREAGDAARWRHDGSCQPTDALEAVHVRRLCTVNLESGIPQSIADELRKRGHEGIRGGWRL